MNGRFSLLCAAILLAFSGNARACDRLLSSESIGPISSNVWDCGDYNFFVHRETCLNGEDFVSTWHVNVENLEGVCPLDYSVVKVCNGDCGEGLRVLGSLQIECPKKLLATEGIERDGNITCPFLYEVYDCPAEWGWREESTCDGGKPLRVRTSVCSDCRGEIVDEDFCGPRNESMPLEERERCPVDDRYHYEWEEGECMFTYPNCYPTQTSTRGCKDETWSVNGPLCERENLEVTLKCELDYDCCKCNNRTLCEACSDDYPIGIFTGDDVIEKPVETTSIETTQVSTTSAATQPKTPEATTTSTTTEEDLEGGLDAQSGALGAGAIGGIVTAPILLLLLAAAALFYLYHKREVVKLKRKIEDKASVHSIEMEDAGI